MDDSKPGGWEWGRRRFMAATPAREDPHCFARMTCTGTRRTLAGAEAATCCPTSAMVSTLVSVPAVVSVFGTHKNVIVVVIVLHWHLWHGEVARMLI